MDLIPTDGRIDTLEEFEKHWDPQVARDRLHLAIACRTIATTARGGKLKRLSTHIEMQPHAARALLSYWVQIEDWGNDRSEFGPWILAATQLRSLLSHASRWLGRKSRSSFRLDRSLSRQAIQSLQSHFKDEGTLTMSGERGHFFALTDTIERHVPWLTDVELAQQVSDAWNTVVERGGADFVGCHCVKCACILREADMDEAWWR